jgi:hypothetical protein
MIMLCFIMGWLYEKYCPIIYLIIIVILFIMKVFKQNLVTFILAICNKMVMIFNVIYYYQLMHQNMNFSNEFI